MIRNTQESFDAKAKGEKFQKDLVALMLKIILTKWRKLWVEQTNVKFYYLEQKKL